MAAISVVRVLIAVSAWSLSSCAANATCKFTQGGPQNLNIVVPATIPAPRDAAVGAVIYTSPFATLPGTAITSCSNDSLGVKNMIGAQPGTGVTSFPIGSTGLSFQWVYNDSGTLYTWASYGTYKTNGGMLAPDLPNAFRLVKTGAIAAGATIPGGAVATFTYGALAAQTMLLSNSISVTQGSCITPNVTVSLGNHALSELPAVGSVSSATPFNIALQGCPAGMNSIMYRIDPVTAVLDSSRSVVAFDSSSTASGAGVQLTDSAGNPVPFRAQIGVGGYVNASGGDFSIALKARYYRTGATLNPGKANSSFTFTISYQ